MCKNESYVGSHILARVFREDNIAYWDGDSER